MARGLCLLSGGLDSSFAAYKLKSEGHDVIAIFADYRQYPAESEYKAASYVCDTLSLRLERIKLDIGVPVAAAWARAVALVGTAAMWAFYNGDDFDFIATGGRVGDVGPDCKPGDFNKYLDKTLTEATKGRIRYILPLREMNLKQVAIGLQSSPLDIEKLFNCFWSPPCRFKSKDDHYLCPGCLRKREALLTIGCRDEILLSRPNTPTISYTTKDKIYELTPPPYGGT